MKCLKFDKTLNYEIYNLFSYETICIVCCCYLCSDP